MYLERMGCENLNQVLHIFFSSSINYLGHVMINFLGTMIRISFWDSFIYSSVIPFHNQFPVYLRDADAYFLFIITQASLA